MDCTAPSKVSSGRGHLASVWLSALLGAHNSHLRDSKLGSHVITMANTDAEPHANDNLFSPEPHSWPFG